MKGIKGSLPAIIKQDMRYDRDARLHKKEYQRYYLHNSYNPKEYIRDLYAKESLKGGWGKDRKRISKRIYGNIDICYDILCKIREKYEWREEYL